MISLSMQPYLISIFLCAGDRVLVTDTVEPVNEVSIYRKSFLVCEERK